MLIEELADESVCATFGARETPDPPAPQFVSDMLHTIFVEPFSFILNLFAVESYQISPAAAPASPAMDDFRKSPVAKVIRPDAESKVRPLEFAEETVIAPVPV